MKPVTIEWMAKELDSEKGLSMNRVTKKQNAGKLIPRAVALSSLGIVICLAGSGCSAPHKTLRMALDMGPIQLVTETSIRDAAIRRFPIGTSKEVMQKALPPSNDPDSTMFWPWFDWWTFYGDESTIEVTSTDYAPLGSRWYYWVKFVFVDGKLSAITVRKSSVHV